MSKALLLSQLLLRLSLSCYMLDYIWYPSLSRDKKYDQQHKDYELVQEYMLTQVLDRFIQYCYPVGAFGRTFMVVMLQCHHFRIGVDSIIHLRQWNEVDLMERQSKLNVCLMLVCLVWDTFYPLPLFGHIYA